MKTSTPTKGTSKKVANTVNASNVSEAMQKSETLVSEKIDFHAEIKGQLKQNENLFKGLKGSLKVEDKKGMTKLNKQESKEQSKIIANGFHGLFNLVDYCKKIGIISKQISAFDVLSKVSIDAVIKAAFNGRRYTIKEIEKACKRLTEDKENSKLNGVNGQRLSLLINEVHNGQKSTLDIQNFLNSLLNEKFINQEKCTTFVAFTMGIFEIPLNQRCLDLFEAKKIQMAESARMNEVKTKLVDLYKSGAISFEEMAEMA